MSGWLQTLLAAAILACFANAALAEDASEIITRFGKPDKDDSTAYDQPRPPIVTRFLDYTRRGVRVMLVPTNPIGSPPPYTWKLFGFVDLRTEKRITPEEAARRLGGQ